MIIVVSASLLLRLGVAWRGLVYRCYGSPHIGAVLRQSPKAGTSYGDTQPVSLKLQANNC